MTYRQDIENYLAYAPADAARLTPLLNQLEQDKGDLFSRKNMTGHLTSSAFVLNAAQTHMLFIGHKALSMWLQPGGHYEAPGSLWESAMREVQEETGVDQLRLHPWHTAHPFPFDIDSHEIPARPDKNEGPHWHHDFAYLALTDNTAALTPQQSETYGAKWIPLTALAQTEGKRLARMLPKLQTALGF